MNITSLSPAERRVFNLLITAKPYKEIASELYLAEGTVRKYYCGRIFKKLNVSNRYELIAKYYMEKIKELTK